MKSLPKFFWPAAVAALLVSTGAMAQSRAQYDSMVASHAAANNVPEALVHRVIVRESKYHPGLVGRGGTIGLMQIKLPTARGLGYTGDAAGLRDPNTNLAWGIKYLAGAYRAANGDHNRAVRYYAGASGRSGPSWPRRCLPVRCLQAMRRRKSSSGGSKRRERPLRRTQCRFPPNSRHGPGHPGLCFHDKERTWMPRDKPGHDEACC